MASPPAFELTATNAHGTVQEGDELPVGGPVTLHVRSDAPPEFARIIFNGTSVVTVDRHEQDFSYQATDRPAVYRVEIRSTRPGQAAWLMSNPIYVRAPAPPADGVARRAATKQVPLFDGKTTTGWHIEHEAASLGAVEVAPAADGSELRLRYALAGAPSAGPFVAAVHDTPNGTGSSDRIGFTVRAEHPMRISVQLRAETGNGAGERWQRSVYVDGSRQARTVYFDDFTPAGPTRTWRPPFDRVRSILFVVDTTNTRAGSTGRVWIGAPVLEQ
jgi:hypothetical protein